MKKYSVILLFLGMLAGCEMAIFDDEIRKAVRSELKDPDSAKFGDRLIYKDRACIEVNAKNSFGGYVGMSARHLQHKLWGWDTQPGIDRACTLDVLQELQAITEKNQKLANEMERELIKKVSEKVEISAAADSLFSTDAKTPCLQMARSIISGYRNALDRRLQGNGQEEVSSAFGWQEEKRDFDRGICEKAEKR